MEIAEILKHVLSTDDMELPEWSKRIERWRKTQDYERQCALFQSKGAQILSAYKKHESTIQRMSEELDGLTARTEAANASDMHRGYYCPSLVRDIYVGNIKRGNLLKSLGSRNKNYFVYGFDKEDRMIWCKSYMKSALVSTEYLVYDGNIRYGFKFDIFNSTIEATQEQFENGRIKSYLHGLCYRTNESIAWARLEQEVYNYDEYGLNSCDLFHFYPVARLLNHDLMIFEREDGLLKRYYIETLVGFEETAIVRKSPVYGVQTKRKA